MKFLPTYRLSIALIPSLLLLSSCFLNQNNSDCIKLDLSNEEKQWFENYRNGDTVFFSSQEKEIDTFIIDMTEGTEYTVCNTFELGPYVYGSRVLCLDNLDNYKHDEMDDGYVLVFDKTGQDTSDVSAFKSLSFFDLNPVGFEHFDKVPRDTFIVPKTGEKIETLIFTKNYNCSNTTGGKEVMRAFAISKKYGLMWYTTLQGVEYNRVW